jgi:hypothetical protein
MMHIASYSVPQPRGLVSATAKPAPDKQEALPGKVPAKAPPATKPIKTATSDPLAPLSAASAKAKGSAPAASAGGGNPKSKPKDSDD